MKQRLVDGARRMLARARRAGATVVRVSAHRWARVRARPPLQRFAILSGGAIVAVFALLLLYTIALIPFTPSIKDLKQARGAKATQLLSADGKTIDTFEQGLQERIKLGQMSPFIISALVATEDHRFYDHHGVDVRRTVGAVLHSLGGNPQGGSTITQQLARNMFPEEIGRSRNLNRKLKELVTALKIEATYSKIEILEAYLNTVPFLYNTFGIEMAARTYFDKSAADLDELESATLVGMLKGTNYYNPVSSPERSLQRRNVVLAQMRKHDQLTEAKYQSLRTRPLRLHFSRQMEKAGSGSHFNAAVRKWLIEWADQNDYNLQLDGLVVQTTLDSALQQAATRAVQRQADTLQAVADVEWSRNGAIGSTSSATYTDMHGGVAPFRYFWESRRALVDAFTRESPEYRKALEGGESAGAAFERLRADGAFQSHLRAAKTRLEAGFVAIDPTSGEVRAWVGSRDFQRDQFDHVAQAARQPGSTFKPLVYGAALEKGIPPEREYLDSVQDIKAADGSVWRPTDMSGSSDAMLPMRDGLIYSKNTITAQVMRDVGLPAIIDLAQASGINQSKLAKVPSLALGTSPVTLLEMVSAYATIAAEGEYRKPILVKRILDRSGHVIAEFGTPPKRAMAVETARQLIDMLRGVINRGTGTAVRYRFGIGADVAGKTGTTQNNTDGWFILMHPQLVGGAWVGFNDARVTMRSNYWGQGGHNAILVVGDFFRTALDGGKLDGAALFAGGKRLAAPAREEEPAQPPNDEANESPEDMNGERPDPPELPVNPAPEAPPPDNE